MTDQPNAGVAVSAATLADKVGFLERGGCCKLLAVKPLGSNFVDKHGLKAWIRRDSAVKVCFKA